MSAELNNTNLASKSLAQDVSKISILRKNGEVLPTEAIQQLKTAIPGVVLFKGEAADDVYRKAIQRHNKAFIKEAGIIVFCESDEDVAISLKYVQEWGLDFTVASGRHSYYGASSTTGLVIDIGKLRKVSIDIANETATAQGGCLAVDLEKPLAAEGYAVVMGAFNETGIGGLTVGGGSGPLSGKHGLVIDNLLAAKVVVADGRILEVDETTNSDLFWAIRGGGSNFGIVTEFTYRIHKQGNVTFGPMIFAPGRVKEVLALLGPLKKVVDSLNGKLTIFLGFLQPPNAPDLQPLALIFYDGPEAEARDYAAPLFQLGPVMEMVKYCPFAEITQPSPLVRGPPNAQNYQTGNLPMWSVDEVDILETIVEDFGAFRSKHGDAVAASKVVVEIRSHAKTSSVPISATAYAARQAVIMMVVEAQYEDTLNHDQIRAEVRSITDKAKDEMRTRAGNREGGAIFNANIGSGEEKTIDMFGENLPRLRELKRKYDPNFIFNRWHPIPPADN